MFIQLQLIVIELYSRKKTMTDAGSAAARNGQPETKMNIAKAAVLGAGTMGAGIAAHLANAGISTLLLDIAPTELTADEEAKGLTLDSPRVRNRIVGSL